MTTPVTDVASDPPVRVLHVLHRLSAGGGVPIVVRRLAAAVDPTEVDLHAVTVRPRFAEDDLDAVPVTLHPLDLTEGIGPLRRLRILVGVAAAARRVRPDVVQVHSGTAWMGLFARLGAPRARLVLEVHDAPGSGRHGAGTDRFEGVLARVARADVVCHSSSVAAEVARRWRVPSERITTFPLSIDVDAVTPLDVDERRAWRERHGVGDDDLVVAAIGRLVPSKRFVDAVAAVDLAERDPRIDRPITFVLVGEGSERPAVEAEARSRGRSDRIRLPGPDYDVRHAIGGADLLVSASEYEGFGLTLVEAMACALPVASRAVGGTTDIVVDGETGRLVASERPDDLADAIAEILTDRDRARALGAAGRRRAEDRFTDRALARNFTAAYRAARDRGH